MTPEGKWIGATHDGHQNFHQSLLLKKGKLEAGTYIILIDPTWNESASFDPEYKKVMLDIYCSQKDIEMWNVTQSAGIEILKKTLKFVAQTMVPKEKRNYH